MADPTQPSWDGPPVDDQAAGFRGTIEEAIRLTQHAERLEAKAERLRSRATDAIDVAADMALRVPLTDAVAACTAVQAAKVRWRQRLIRLFPTRRGHVTLAKPGDVYRRTRWPARGEDGLWPAAAAWVYLMLVPSNVAGVAPRASYRETIGMADASQGWTVVYVGMTTRSTVKKRMKGHQYSNVWHEIEMIACADEAEALRIEGDLIYQHKPPLNQSGIRTRRSVPA